MRRAHRPTATVLTAVATLLLVAGCGGSRSSGPIGEYSGGWAAPFAGARNANSVNVDGPRSLTLSWSRPVGGIIPQAVTTGPQGQVLVAARTASGCNVFGFEDTDGRKSWCNRVDFGDGLVSPVVDRRANSYVGVLGAMLSFNNFGQTRWQTPVDGTPLSAQFTPSGDVLSVTQLGEIDVLSTQTGEKQVASYRLIPETTPPPPDLGLKACADGGPECPVSNPPAVDLHTDRFYLTFWRPGAAQPSLLAMSYGKEAGSGGDPVIKQVWSADGLPGGATSAPALSADGKTVYVVDGKSDIVAIDAQSGKTKWTHRLRSPGGRTLAVSPDGLIIPAGTDRGPLVAIQDEGDHARVAWVRGDVAVAGVPALGGGSVGYVSVRDGANGLALLTFDLSDGKTLDRDILPGGTGSGVTAISDDGRVVAASRIGELFTFTG